MGTRCLVGTRCLMRTRWLMAAALRTPARFGQRDCNLVPLSWRVALHQVEFRGGGATHQRSRAWKGVVRDEVEALGAGARRAGERGAVARRAARRPLRDPALHDQVGDRGGGVVLHGDRRGALETI